MHVLFIFLFLYSMERDCFQKDLQKQQILLTNNAQKAPNYLSILPHDLLDNQIALPILLQEDPRASTNFFNLLLATQHGNKRKYKDVFENYWHDHLDTISSENDRYEQNIARCKLFDCCSTYFKLEILLHLLEVCHGTPPFATLAHKVNFTHSDEIFLYYYFRGCPR